MSLSIGDLAPDFTLYSDEKKPWRLYDQRGRNVVVLFFPAAFSSVCTTELSTVNSNLAYFNDPNATVVGISTDLPYSLAEYRVVLGLKFSLLCDHDASVCSSYGARFEGSFGGMGYDRIAKRAVFVLNGNGKIVHSEVLENPGREPDYEAILTALETL